MNPDTWLAVALVLFVIGGVWSAVERSIVTTLLLVGLAAQVAYFLAL